MSKKPIEELELFFKEYGPVKGPIQLDKCTTVLDPQKMIESHLEIIKANGIGGIWSTYYKRLQELKKQIK